MPDFLVPDKDYHRNLRFWGIRSSILCSARARSQCRVSAAVRSADHTDGSADPVCGSADAMDGSADSTGVSADPIGRDVISNAGAFAMSRRRALVRRGQHDELGHQHHQPTVRLGARLLGRSPRNLPPLRGSSPALRPRRCRLRLRLRRYRRRRRGRDRSGGRLHRRSRCSASFAATVCGLLMTTGCCHIS